MLSPKFSDVAFMGFLLLLGLVTVLLGYYYLTVIGIAFLTPKEKAILLTAFVLVVLLLGISFISHNQSLKKGLVIIISNVIAIECILQALAAIGALPAVSTFSHLPYGRVYWTQEGFDSSMMNRYGWHYPPLALTENSRRIALIGDSFIQAVQVSPSQNIGAVLQQGLNTKHKKQEAITTEVIALGLSSIGPAQYLELLKYAVEYFQPDEAVIFIFLGNDFRNSSHKIQSTESPNRYVYYVINDTGDIELHPQSKAAQERLILSLRGNHRPLLATLGPTLLSHSMLFHTMETVIHQIRGGFVTADTSTQDVSPGGVESVLQSLGLDGFIFREDFTQEEREAIQIAFHVLEECQRFALTNGIRLHLVTIPFFPKVLHSHAPQENWSPVVNGYDFFRPERLLVDFATEHQIPILPMGKRMQDNRLSLDQVRALYLIEGQGHFSVHGHRYFADSVHAHLTSDADTRIPNENTEDSYALEPEIKESSIDLLNK